MFRYKLVFLQSRLKQLLITFQMVSSEVDSAVERLYRIKNVYV